MPIQAAVPTRILLYLFGSTKKGQAFFVDQRLFCGMFCLLGTIDASAVREMNL
jgi:hypothetical protein